LAEEESEVVALPGEEPSTASESGVKGGKEDKSDSLKAVNSDQSSAPPATQGQINEAGSDQGRGDRAAASPETSSDSVLGELFGSPGDGSERTNNAAESGVSDEQSATEGTEIEALGELFTEGEGQEMKQREVDDLEGYAFEGDS